MLFQKFLHVIKNSGASLVVQWLIIRLPMQGTQVRALVLEDPTCCRATKPVHHNYWACALEPASYNYWACVPQLLKPAHLEPVLRNKRSHHNEKPMHRRVVPAHRNQRKACAQQRRHNAAKKTKQSKTKQKVPCANSLQLVLNILQTLKFSVAVTFCREPFFISKSGLTVLPLYFHILYIFLF